MRWMKYKNEEGQEEKFYPITHASAVVGLDINEGDSIYEEKIVELITENSDITTSVLADEISGSNVEISPLVQNEINNINNNLFHIFILLVNFEIPITNITTPKTE